MHLKSNLSRSPISTKKHQQAANDPGALNTWEAPLHAWQGAPCAVTDSDSLCLTLCRRVAMASMTQTTHYCRMPTGCVRVQGV
jgi:hypothetical protein